MRIFHNQETFPANLFDNGLISMLLQLKLVQSVQPYSCSLRNFLILFELF